LGSVYHWFPGADVPLPTLTPEASLVSWPPLQLVICAVLVS
jgi:hypothetical protein